MAGLVWARRRTYPRGYAPDGWPRWVPESDTEVQDLRVWTTCLAMAAYSAPVAVEVQELWAAERATLAFDLGRSREEVSDEVEVIHTFLLGLSLRRLLDPELTTARALALLDHVLQSLGHGPRDDVG